MYTTGDSRVFCAGNCTCCLYMYIKVLYTCTCIFIDKFHFSLTQLPIHQQHQCMEFITGTTYTSLTLDFTPVFFLVGSDFIFLCCVFCFVYELYLVQNQRNTTLFLYWPCLCAIVCDLLELKWSQQQLKLFKATAALYDKHGNKVKAKNLIMFY